MELTELTTLMQEKAKATSPIGNSVKFVFEDSVLHLDGKGEENLVCNDDLEADCTIKMAQADFEAMTSGQLNPMGAFMSGKLKVEGDMSVAMKLQNLLT